MEYQFEWIWEKCFATCYRPGYPWNEVSRYQIEKFTTYLQKQGIQHIVCLLTPEEIASEYLKSPILVYRELGLQVSHLSLPTEIKTNDSDAVVDFILQQLEQGQPVLLHGQSKEKRVLQVRNRVLEKLETISLPETVFPIPSAEPSEALSSPETSSETQIEKPFEETLSSKESEPLILKSEDPTLQEAKKSLEKFDIYLSSLQNLQNQIEHYATRSQLDTASVSYLEQTITVRKSSLEYEYKQAKLALAKQESELQEKASAPAFTVKESRQESIEKKKKLLESIAQISPEIDPIAKEIILEKVILPVPAVLPVKEISSPALSKKAVKKPKLFKFKEEIVDKKIAAPLVQIQQKISPLLPLLYEKALWFLGSLFILIAAIYWVSNAWTSMKDANKLLVILGSLFGLQSMNFFTGYFLQHKLGLHSGGQNLKMSAIVLTPLLFVILGEIFSKPLSWQTLLSGGAIFSFYFTRKTLADFAPVYQKPFLLLFLFYTLWQIPLSFAHGGNLEALLILPIALSILPLCAYFYFRLLPQISSRVPLHLHFFFGIFSYLYLFSLGHLYFRISRNVFPSLHLEGILTTLLGCGLFLFATPSATKDQRRTFTFFSGIGLTFTILGLFLSFGQFSSTLGFFQTKLLVVLILLAITYWKAAFLFQRVYLFTASIFLGLGVYFLTPATLKLQLQIFGRSFSWIKETFGYSQNQKLPLSYFPITFLPFLIALAGYTFKNREWLRPSFYRAVQGIFGLISTVFTVFLVYGGLTDIRPALVACPLYVVLLSSFYLLFRYPAYLEGATAYAFLWTWYLGDALPLLPRLTLLLIPLVLLSLLVSRLTRPKLLELGAKQIFFYFHALFLALVFAQIYAPPAPMSFYLLGTIGMVLAFCYSFGWTESSKNWNSLPHLAIASLFLGAYLVYVQFGVFDTFLQRLCSGVPYAYGNWIGICSLLYAGFFLILFRFKKWILSPTLLLGYAVFSLLVGYSLTAYYAEMVFTLPIQVYFLGQTLLLFFVFDAFSLKSLDPFKHLASLPLLTGVFLCSGILQMQAPQTYLSEINFIFFQIVILLGVSFARKHAELLQLALFVLPFATGLLSVALPSIAVSLDTIAVFFAFVYVVCSCVPFVKKDPLLAQGALREFSILFYVVSIFFSFSTYSSVSASQYVSLTFAINTLTSLFFLWLYQSKFASIVAFVSSLVLIGSLQRDLQHYHFFVSWYLFALAAFWWVILILFEHSFTRKATRLLAWFPVIPTLFALAIHYNELAFVSWSVFREMDYYTLVGFAFSTLAMVHVLWLYCVWRQWWFANYLIVPAILLFILTPYRLGTGISSWSPIFYKICLVPVECLLFGFLFARHKKLKECNIQGILHSSMLLGLSLLGFLTLTRLDFVLSTSYLSYFYTKDPFITPTILAELQLYRSAILLVFFFAGYFFWKKWFWTFRAAILSLSLFGLGSLDLAQASPSSYAFYFNCLGLFLLFKQEWHFDMRWMGWLCNSLFAFFLFGEMLHTYDADWSISLASLIVFMFSCLVETGTQRTLFPLCGAVVTLLFAFGWNICAGFLRGGTLNSIVATTLFTGILTGIALRRKYVFQWRHFYIGEDLLQKGFSCVSSAMILLAFLYEMILIGLRELPMGSILYAGPEHAWKLFFGHFALVLGLFPSILFLGFSSFFAFVVVTHYTPFYRLILQEPLRHSYYPAGFDWIFFAFVFQGLCSIKTIREAIRSQIELLFGILIVLGLVLTRFEIHFSTFALFGSATLFFLIKREIPLWHLLSCGVGGATLYFYTNYLRVTPFEDARFWYSLPLALVFASWVGELIFREKWWFRFARLTLVSHITLFYFLMQHWLFGDLFRPSLFIESATLFLIFFHYFWQGRKELRFQYLFALSLSSAFFYYRWMTPYLNFWSVPPEFFWITLSFILFVIASLCPSASWRQALGIGLLLNIGYAFLPPPYGMQRDWVLSSPTWWVLSAFLFTGSGLRLIPEGRKEFNLVAIVAVCGSIFGILLTNPLPLHPWWYLVPSLLGCGLTLFIYRIDASNIALGTFSFIFFLCGFLPAIQGIGAVAPLYLDLYLMVALVLLVFYFVLLRVVQNATIQEQTTLAFQNLFTFFGAIFVLVYGVWFISREPLFASLRLLRPSFGVGTHSGLLLAELVGFFLFYGFLHWKLKLKEMLYFSISFLGLFLFLLAPFEHLLLFSFSFQPLTPSLEFLLLSCILIRVKQLEGAMVIAVLGVLSTKLSHSTPITAMVFFAFSFHFLLRLWQTRAKEDHYCLHGTFLAGVYFFIFYLLPDTGRNKLLVLPLLALVNWWFVFALLRLIKSAPVWLGEDRRRETISVAFFCSYLSSLMLLSTFLFVDIASHDLTTRLLTVVSMAFGGWIFYQLACQFKQPNLYFLFQFHFLEMFLFLKYRTLYLDFIPDMYVAHSLVFIGFIFCQVNYFIQEATLVRSFQLSGIFLPFISVLFLELKIQLPLSQYLFLLGAHYFFLSSQIQTLQKFSLELPHLRIIFRLVGLFSINLAFFSFLYLNGWRDPQLYGLPLGISLIAVAEFHRKDLGETQTHFFRFLGILAMFGSSSVELLNVANPVNALVIALTGIGLIGIGFWLQLRFYLFVGAIAVLLDAIGHLILFGVQRGILGAILLFLLGIVFIIFAIYTSLKRLKEKETPP